MGSARTDELKAKLDELAAAIVTDPAELAKFGQAWSAGFRTYSMHNQILIWSQRPTATLCAGLKAWTAKHGRKVKKGSAAIWILAPRFATVTDPDRKDPETGKPHEFKRLIGFTDCYVFDVADTEGKPIDIGAGQYIKGTAGTYPVEKALEAFKLPLVWESEFTLHNGATDGRQVWLSKRSNPAAIFHTCLHEIAHTILHCRKPKDGADPVKIIDGEIVPRDVKELEAEATAYLVGSLFGIQSEKSAHYIGGWTGDRSKDEIKKAALRILSAAERIIRTFEKAGILKHAPANAHNDTQTTPAPAPTATPAPAPIEAPAPEPVPPAAVIAATRTPAPQPEQGTLF
jgi:antirestriction protein ArdC